MEIFAGLAAGAAAAAPCLLFGAFAVLVAALAIYSYYKARERREALARLAAEWGFQFYPDDPWSMESRYSHFDLFGAGHSRRASNVLAGAVDGRTILVCDYRYKTGSGKHESTHHYVAAILELPILAARLRLRKEGLLDRVASWVGHDDIDFESDEFSRRYHVKSDDRKFAYDLFHARLIDYLLRCGETPDIEMNGPILLLYESGSDLGTFRRLRAIGDEMIRSIPDYVRKARGQGAGAGGQP